MIYLAVYVVIAIGFLAFSLADDAERALRGAIPNPKASAWLAAFWPLWLFVALIVYARNAR